MEKLDSLTEEQKARFPEICAEWLGHGLRVGKTDEPKAEAAVKLAYKCAGLSEPEMILWFDSPLEGAYAAAFIRKLGKSFLNNIRDEFFSRIISLEDQVSGAFRDRVEDLVWGGVRDKVRVQVREQVGIEVQSQVIEQVIDEVQGQVSNQVRDKVRDQVQDQVHDQVSKKVSKQVWYRVRAQVWDQVRDQVLDQVRDQVWDEVHDRVHDQVQGQVLDQVRGQVRDKVRDQVKGQVRDQVQGQVWAQVYAQVWDKVRDKVRDKVQDQVHDQVSEQVYAQVWAQVWAQVRFAEQLPKEISAEIARACYGQHDSSWLGFFSTFADFGIDCPELEGLVQTAKSCSWWWPFEEVAIVTRYPVELHRDERNRLHCTSGPAILYADGFGVYAVSGVRIDAKIIEHPETLTTTHIQEEKNSEVRRVLVDLYGAEKYLRDLGAKFINEDSYGRLYTVAQGSDEAIVMVELINSTPEPLSYNPKPGEYGVTIGKRFYKNYMLRVPPYVKTAHEAVAWIDKMSVDAYAPLIET